MSRPRKSAKIQAFKDIRRAERDERLRRNGTVRLAPMPGGARKMIFTGERRDHVIAKVVAMLQDWQATPFENEGLCRHGIRSALCLDGFTWVRSDMEAASLVEQALGQMRAVRPTWEQGQREYVVPRENCAHCGVDLDDQQISHGDRFCSDMCAKSYLQRAEQIWMRRGEETVRSAQRVITIAVRPKRTCDQCGTEYRKRGNSTDGQFCSVRCAGEAKRTVPERPCKHCGTMFRPENNLNKGEFCSRPCAYAHRKNATITRCCTYCGDTYLSRSPKSKHCSTACSKAAQRATEGTLPKRLLRHVFDHFITVPVNSQPRLTSARFDDLVDSA